MTFKQNTYQTPLAGGLETRLPQNPQNANVAQNLVMDTETGGWSTRLGYEPFKTGATDWAPFTVSGPIYSLHAAQHLAGGARQHILYEDSGQLQLLYEASGGLVIMVQVVDTVAVVEMILKTTKEASRRVLLLLLLPWVVVEVLAEALKAAVVVGL